MTAAVPFVGGSFDRCVRTETSGRQYIRSGHYYRNANKGIGKPLWVCANCGREKP